MHVGHVRMFKQAKKLGDRLVVILNSDRFLKKKKNYVFMPFKERKEMIEGIRYVDRVVPCIDKDQTVCQTLRKLKPDIFANGGDRTDKNIPEYALCDELGIKMIFNVGGGKVQSSSWLVNKVKDDKKKTKKR